MNIQRYSCRSVFLLTVVYLKQLASFQSPRLSNNSLLCSAAWGNNLVAFHQLLHEEIKPPSVIYQLGASPDSISHSYIPVWKHSIHGQNNICYYLEVVNGDSRSWSDLEFTLWLNLLITFAAMLLKWLLRRLPRWCSQLQSCCLFDCWRWHTNDSAEKTYFFIFQSHYRSPV